MSQIAAQVDPQLTGTWTTKSRKVVTGPVRSMNLFLRRWMLYEQAIGLVEENELKACY